jgi:hypothetical protein
MSSEHFGQLAWQFKRMSGSPGSPRPRVSGSKDGKLRLVYAPIDAANVVLLGTAPTAEADSDPYMTSGPEPPWVIYGDPLTPPGFAKLFCERISKKCGHAGLSAKSLHNLLPLRSRSLRPCANRRTLALASLHCLYNKRKVCDTPRPIL